MSYDIGIMRPVHPDAKQDGDSELRITSFAGPSGPPHHNPKWIQLSMGKETIRLNGPQIFALYTLLGMRIEGTDTPMLDISEDIDPANPDLDVR